jgi:hypothetical protein
MFTQLSAARHVAYDILTHVQYHLYSNPANFHLIGLCNQQKCLFYLLTVITKASVVAVVGLSNFYMDYRITYIHRHVHQSPPLSLKCTYHIQLSTHTSITPLNMCISVIPFIGYTDRRGGSLLTIYRCTLLLGLPLY